jgi:hypothetical protein
VRKPRNPRLKRVTFLKSLFQEHLSPCVTVSITERVIIAKVELQTAPTRDIKRSSLGIAAARANVKISKLNLNTYSALSAFRGDILLWRKGLRTFTGT